MGIGGAIGRRRPHPHTGELDADQRSQIGQHLGQLRGDAEACRRIRSACITPNSSVAR